MDIQEIYLINKLSPKYNEKEKRGDDVSTIKLRFLNFNVLNTQDVLSERIVQKFHLEYEISQFIEYHKKLKEASDITNFPFFEDIGDLEPMPIEVNNNTVAIYEELRKKAEIKEEKSKK